MGKDFAWTCHRSGDCCLGPSVVITPEEQAALEQARPDVPVWTEPRPDGFVTWKQPHGCPMLARDVDGKARCTAYEVRPLNCRRFHCFRDEGEPFRGGGPLGCQNLTDRLTSNRHALAFYRTAQRFAHKEWGAAHGWHK